MLDILTDPGAWLSFLTLTVLEIVLGIDNIIFLSILVSRLPPELQQRGRVLGLALAMITRIALLFSITWITRLTAPLFTVLSEEFSGRDLVLFAGGLFLLVKSVNEIHGALEGADGPQAGVSLKSRILGVVIQIGLIDIVFSLDSVFTAIGLAQHVEIMVTAIVIAVLVMMFLARPINQFIDRHPTIKILALAFLFVIGLALVAEAFDVEIPKGYLYCSMAFAFGVEMINIRMRRMGRPVDLHGPDLPPEDVQKR